ncbi:PREDICTED: RNA polymerase II C-terminal domain phosphatase-like 4 [Camelina sativa]|uniref:RNA polymerase II C-terminal domain phosphatase-like n=1 Tax=Camelina sativa TaxID=90675 RepID=A0ABM0XLB4_CAMSA|nr:PREDICTED: RNA polymerase II C-terminal domain phosphatase-like 4 [Camelina sativa]
MFVVESDYMEVAPSINESSPSPSSSRSCDHWYVRYGVCIACKSTVNKRQGRAFNYLIKGLQLSHEAAVFTKRFTTQYHLVNEKKLHLVLDLDYTLLDSIRASLLSETDKYLLEEACSREDLWRVDTGFLTKLRPFVHEFLKEANKMFTMYVYTMGNRVYAKSVLKAIDPKRIYFGDRVITRDESPYAKTLDLVLAEERGVVIVDDTRDVWTHHQSNLVEINEYHYFRVVDGPEEPISYTAEKTDESSSDGELAKVLNILKEVHCGFFRVKEDLESQDVRFLLQEIDFKLLTKDA